MQALRPFVAGAGLEIGVGTGRFAAALGIGTGVEPAPAMAARARERGIDVRAGVAEDLPFDDASFDVALLVATLCFVSDLPTALSEARRVLRPAGRLVIGLLDRDAPLGQSTEARKARSPFYAGATLRSTAEVTAALAAAGFRVDALRQTIFGDPADGDRAWPVRPGAGEGGFVAICASILPGC